MFNSPSHFRYHGQLCRACDYLCNDSVREIRLEHDRDNILLKPQLLNVHYIETRPQKSLIIARYQFPLTVAPSPASSSKNKG